MKTTSWKRVLGLAIAMLVTFGMAVTGAWAYFSDVETSTGNLLSAGTLDLFSQVGGSGTPGKYTVTPGGNGINGNVVFSNMLPGESGSITWVLINLGSLPGTLSLYSTVSFSENGTGYPEAWVTGNNGGGNGDLDECVGVRLLRGIGTDRVSAEANFTYVLGDAGYYVPFAGLKAALDAQSISLAPDGGNDTVVYKLEWLIATDVKKAGADGIFGTSDDEDVNENIIQSDTAQIDINFTLSQ